LKIIPSADIGELGANQGTAVVYNWKLYYSIPALALWVVLLGAIVLVKANRNPRALLIVLPLLVVNLLWFGFVKLLNFPSITRAEFDPLFASYTVGIAVLWLFAHKLGNRNRFVTFLLALIIMIVVGIVGLASYSTGEFSEQTVVFLMFLAILALAALVGFVLAAWRCREHYNGLRFILWLGIGTVIGSIVSLLFFMGIMFIVVGNVRDNLTSVMLLQILVMGLVAGLLLYVINLSFMIFGLNVSFFRERFYACLRLKSMPTTTGQADADQPNEQSSSPGTS